MKYALCDFGKILSGKVVMPVSLHATWADALAAKKAMGRKWNFLRVVETAEFWEAVQ